MNRSTEESLSVVESFDNSPSGTVDTRLAHIADDWFVYTFSLTTGEIRKGNEFAQHTAAGIRYLFGPMTEDAARRLYNHRKDVHDAALALGSMTSERKAAAARENGKRGGRPRVYKLDWEWNGITVHESKAGFVVKYWTRIQGQANGLRVLVPYTVDYPKGLDLSAMWNESTTNGERIAHERGEDSTARILRHGHIVQ